VEEARSVAKGLWSSVPRRTRLPLPSAIGCCLADEKHYVQLLKRLAPPFIREVFASFRCGELSGVLAAAELGLSRSRFYELYADYLRACAHRRARHWTPGISGGDHLAPWPQEVESLLRKLLSNRPPASYSLASSELKRRLNFELDPASVRRFALAESLAPAKASKKPKAAIRRWQCAKIGALWQLDATPHRWWPEGPMLPLLNMLDDCSRRRVDLSLRIAPRLPRLPPAGLPHPWPPAAPLRRLP
jgi:hypothetical protein